MAHCAKTRFVGGGRAAWLILLRDFVVFKANDTLVYQRKHGGRSYVRWRVFRNHRRGFWYPDKRRAFVVPECIAETLGAVIAAAVGGKGVTKLPKMAGEAGCRT